MTTDPAIASAPDVSVIVPAFDRVAGLKQCLIALASQTVPKERFEVIVCDDGSAVPVASALADMLHDFGDRLRVRVVRQHNAGPAAARNYGAAAARGRYLAFTDDDCRPAPDWLEQLLQQFALRPNALLGGGMRTAAHSDRYARATDAIMRFVYADQERRGGMRLFSTSNLALPARGFRELGGFSPVFKHPAGEDYDLCGRWYSAGGETVYTPDAIVVHDHALNGRAYWQQHFNYGRGLLAMRQRLMRRGVRVRPDSLPGSFHLRLIASPLTSMGVKGVGCALLVGVAQAATAAGVLKELMHTALPRTTRMASRQREETL